MGETAFNDAHQERPRRSISPSGGKSHFMSILSDTCAGVIL